MFRPFKIVQGHRSLHESKAHMISYIPILIVFWRPQLYLAPFPTYNAAKSITSTPQLISSSNLQCERYRDTLISGNCIIPASIILSHHRRQTTSDDSIAELCNAVASSAKTEFIDLILHSDTANKTVGKTNEIRTLHLRILTVDRNSDITSLTMSQTTDDLHT